MRWFALLAIASACLSACGTTGPTAKVAAGAEPLTLELRPVDGSSSFVYERVVVYGADGQPDATFEIEGRTRMQRAEAGVTDVTFYVDTARMVHGREDKSYPYDGQLRMSAGCT